MRQTPPEPLVELLGQLGLASPDDFRAVAGRTRRLARGLPLFESVWVDALAQGGVLTAFQASEINARRADALRVGPYLLDYPLGSLQYAVAYAAHAAEKGDPVRLIIADVAMSTPRESAELLDRLEKLIADSAPLAASHGPTSHGPTSHGPLPITAAGIDNTHAWAAYQPANGRTAAEWMIHNGRFPPPAVLEIARAMTAALAELQRLMLWHGDIRAQTLLLTGEGRVLLPHPGLRAVFRDKESHATANLPPEAYDGLAPERSARGEPSSPSGDMFACGCLWWHLLTARAALPGGSGLAKMRAAASFDVPDVRPLAPDTPKVLADAMAACVARDADARPESFEQLAQMLGPANHAGHRLLIRSLRNPGGWNQFAGGKRLPAGGWRMTGKLAIAVVAVAVVAVAAWFALPGGKSGSHAVESGSGTCFQPVKKHGQDGRAAGVPAQKSVQTVESLLLDADPLGAGPLDAASLRFQSGQRVSPKGGGRSRLLVPADGLVVDVADVRFERIDFVNKHASEGSVIIDLRAAGVAFQGCTFSSDSGRPTAIRWTHPGRWIHPGDQSEPELSLPSGRISFENCVFTTVAAAVDCRTKAAISIRVANVLHLGSGPLVRLERMPRPDEPFSLALDRTTLRDSGPLLEFHVGQQSKPKESARVLIETTASVLMPAAGDAGNGLLVFLGESSPEPFLERIEWTGQGSLVGETTAIAQWRRPTGDTTALDDAAVSIAGLVRSKVEFAGAADAGVAASRITKWQAPIRSSDPPGVDVTLLPKK